MHELTITLLAGAIALTGSTAVLAQQEGRHGPQGDLTRAAVEQRTAEAFKRLDANSDGKLDTADREAREKAMFERVDADGSGAISFAEFTAMHKARGGERAEHRGKRGERGGDRRQMAMRDMHGGPGMGPRGMIRDADANKDGTITQAEFQTAALTRFDAADTDKDGTITAAERKAQHDNMRDKWRERRAQRVG